MRYKELNSAIYSKEYAAALQLLSLDAATNPKTWQVVFNCEAWEFALALASYCHAKGINLAQEFGAERFCGTLGSAISHPHADSIIVMHALLSFDTSGLDLSQLTQTLWGDKEELMKTAVNRKDPHKVILLKHAFPNTCVVYDRLELFLWGHNISVSDEDSMFWLACLLEHDVIRFRNYSEFYETLETKMRDWQSAYDYDQGTIDQIQEEKWKWLKKLYNCKASNLTFSGLTSGTVAIPANLKL